MTHDSLRSSCVRSFLASFGLERRAGNIELLSVLRVTFQFIAIAFIAPPLRRNCDFFFFHCSEEWPQWHCSVPQQHRHRHALVAAELGRTLLTAARSPASPANKPSVVLEFSAVYSDFGNGKTS